jgi:hypothetical protein
LSQASPIGAFNEREGGDGEGEVFENGGGTPWPLIARSKASNPLAFKEGRWVEEDEAEELLDVLPSSSLGRPLPMGCAELLPTRGSVKLSPLDLPFVTDWGINAGLCVPPRLLVDVESLTYSDSRLGRRDEEEEGEGKCPVLAI